MTSRRVSMGIGQLRALIASGRKPGILKALDFDFIEVEEGRAVFAGTPGEHAYNPTRHGARRLCRHAARLRLRLRGALAPLGYAGLHDGRDQGRVPQGDHRDTGLLRAEGKVISIGRKAAFTEGKLTDAAGRLYASATSTLLIFEPLTVTVG